LDDKHRIQRQQDGFEPMNDAGLELMIQPTDISAEQEMENLLYTLSHDMRAPFVTLRGFVEELTMLTDDLSQQLDEVAAGLDENQRQQISETLADIPEIKQYINLSVQQLDLYLHDLLTLSRLGRKLITISEVHLNSVVDEALELLSAQEDTSTATITVDTLPTCAGDSDALAIVFQHVLNNALRYAEPDRAPEIHVSGEIVEDRVHLTIQDNGRGLSQEDATLVFEPFFRVGWPGIEGRGMGLTYARKLTRMQGGAMDCESTEGVGTIFHVWLPTPDAVS
jgi:signal transduction histidine kinase